MNIGQFELEVLQGVFALLGIVLTAAVPVLLQKMFALLAAHKVVVSQQQQQLLVDALHDAVPRAINAAEHNAEAQVDPGKKTDLGSPFMNAAANYLIANKGQTLAALGIPPVPNAAQMRQIILAHMPPPAKSP